MDVQRVEERAKQLFQSNLYCAGLIGCDLGTADAVFCLITLMKP